MKSIDIILTVIVVKHCDYMIFLKYIEKMNSLIKLMLNLY